MWAIVEGQILQVLRPTARRPANVSKFPVIQLNGRSGLLDRYALNVDLEIKSYSKSVNILLIFLQFSFSLQYSLKFYWSSIYTISTNSY